MKSIDTGWPAFPRDHRHEGHNGMTLRDYFAAKAMQGWLSTYPGDIAAQVVDKSGLAQWVYEVADAMLKARAE